MIVRRRCHFWLVGLAACHSYTAQPVDLAAHARAFAARLPDRANFAEFLPTDGPAGADAIASRIDLGDGLDRSEGRLVAAVFHPECRAARTGVATARAVRDHSGQWQDPELSLQLERILESVPHQWLAGASVGLGLPWNGRLAAERGVADSELQARLLDLRLAEEHAVAALDSAWVQWSSTELRGERLTALVAQLQALEAIARRLADAGAATELDARQFVLERLRRQAELERNRAESDLARMHLIARLGLPPTAAVELQRDLGIALHLADLEARRAASTTGPKLAAAAAEHAVAERQLALAIRKQWPDLVLAPGWAEEDGQPRATLGLSLPLPLLAGNDAEIATATARRHALAEAWRATYETVQHQLAIAERRLLAAQQQQELLGNELLPLAERQLADGKHLAELGTLDPFLLLDTLLRLHDAQLAALDAAQERALAAITLNTFTWFGLPLPRPAADPTMSQDAR